MPKKIDLTEQRFGNLIALHSTGKNKREGSIWLCKCDCGKETTAFAHQLRRGGKKHCSHSCPLTPQRQKAQRHSRHLLYQRWLTIKSRCTNQNTEAFKDYGGRGIQICREWRDDFSKFRDWAESNGWKPGCNLQIDRIDNDGDYEPSNCRFTSSRENSLNTRTQNNNTSGYVGVYKHGKKWQARIGIKTRGIHIGTYLTKEEAVNARNKYITDNNLQHEYKTQTI